MSLIATSDQIKRPLSMPLNQLDLSDPWLGEAVPPLENIGEPFTWRLVIKQVAIRKKIGSIELPDSAVDAQSWTHGLGIVLKLGPCAFKGRKWEDLGLADEDKPKVGQLIAFQARGVPTRLKVDGIELLVIPDDAFYMTLTPEQAQHVSFAL